MDYLREINAFERWLETNYLPSLSQLLWYRLMALCNRAGWPEWVAVDNQRLMAMIQCKRTHTAIDLRDKLVEAGIIEYRKGKKGSPNQYKICSFTSAPQTAPYTAPFSAPYTAPQTAHIPSYPTDTQETKTKTTPTPEKVAREDGGAGAAYCIENLMSMSAGNFEDLRELMNSGITDELVIYAVDEANAQGKRVWSYVRTILNRFLCDGVKTVGDAKAAAAKRKAQTARPSHGKQLPNIGDIDAHGRVWNGSRWEIRDG